MSRDGCVRVLASAKVLCQKRRGVGFGGCFSVSVVMGMELISLYLWRVRGTYVGNTLGRIAVLRSATSGSWSE